MKKPGGLKDLNKTFGIWYEDIKYNTLTYLPQYLDEELLWILP